MPHRTHTTDTTDSARESVAILNSKFSIPNSSRFADIERRQAEARRHLAPAALETYAPLRDALEKLTTSEAPDAEFLAKLRALHRDIPSLFSKLDPAPLATALEKATAPALIAGVLHRLPPRLLHASGGKPCGDSYIPTWKQCRLKISEPDWTGSKKSMKARALESMAKIKKPMSHPGTGLEVSMNREARKKTILQAKSTHALMAANILPHIFLNSEYSGHTTDRKERPEIKAFHSFKTNVSFGKNNYTAEITATEYTNEEVLHFKVLHLRPKK